MLAAAGTVLLGIAVILGLIMLTGIRMMIKEALAEVIGHVPATIITGIAFLVLIGIFIH